MAKKSNTTVDLDPVKEKLKEIKLALKTSSVGEQIVKDLVAGVRNDAINWRTGKRFHALADATIQGRRYLAKHNKTHKAYSLKKPNLTISGKFLKSIKAKTSVTKSSIKWSVDATGTHPGYKTGGERTPKISNQILRAHLHDIGRDPLFVSKKVRKVIQKTILKEVKASLKRWL